MTTRRKYGTGAVTTGLTALVTILFGNLQTTKDLLTSAQEAGGAPKMLADLVLNPAFGFILVIVAIVLGVRTVRSDAPVPVDTPKSPEAPASPATDAKKKAQFREIVANRDFINETVEIDGKLFDGCKFQNVTLVYDGHEATGFIRQKFVGTTKITTKNKAAETYARFLLGFTKMDGFQAMQRLTQGRDGRFVSTGLEEMAELEDLLAELALRYTRLDMFRLTMLRLGDSVTGDDLATTADSISTIRQQLIEIAKVALHPEHVKWLEATTPDPNFPLMVPGLVSDIDNLKTVLGRVWMQVSVQNTKVKESYRP